VTVYQGGDLDPTLYSYWALHTKGPFLGIGRGETLFDRLRADAVINTRTSRDLTARSGDTLLVGCVVAYLAVRRWNCQYPSR
jgi:hypothetical protein